MAGDLSIFNLLKNKGINLTEPTTIEVSEDSSWKYVSIPIAAAAHYGQTEMLKILLKQKGLNLSHPAQFFNKYGRVKSCPCKIPGCAY